MKLGPLPSLKIAYFSGSQGYTTLPIERAPGMPMPIEEAVARLKNVLHECKTDYHYVPSPEDFEALDRTIAVLENDVP
jgi:hypothetical protein